MPFEIKVLDTINCPRCNGKAELRIDQHKNDIERVLVYIICPICRLNKYSHTILKDDLKIAKRIKTLKNRHALANNPNVKRSILDKITKLEQLRGRQKGV